MSRYEEIIGLPHKVAEGRKHMDRSDRAAQFSAFEALSGHSDAIEGEEKRVEMRGYFDRRLVVLARTILHSIQKKSA